MQFNKGNNRRGVFTKTILVVDDEVFWVDFFKLEIAEAHPEIEIVHAENGEEGVERVKERMVPIEGEVMKPFDAIIMDIQMPIMDGCTAVRIIRDLLYTGPIIVWSAYRDSADDLNRVLDIPVSGFCVKEGTLETMLSHLRAFKVID